jgi:leader peptidase (prepilin peptidase)/N-methyltransferase
VTEALLALLFGLLIGSFLNVCIHRWPRDLSVVRPRSHCVACKQTIAWYDNIPLASYALLRGRCRHCGTRISPRYPVVELLTGALFFFCVYRWGITPEAGKMCLFVAAMTGLAFSDLEELILPDELTLGGLAAGLVLAWFIPVPEGPVQMFGFWIPAGPRALSFGDAAIGAAVPAACLWFGGWLFEKIRHKEGLGFGDVKLVAMTGAFLGIHGALLTLLLGSIAGSVIGYAYIRITRQDASSYPLPFGTFLAFAAIVVALWPGVVLKVPNPC